MARLAKRGEGLAKRIRSAHAHYGISGFPWAGTELDRLTVEAEEWAGDAAIGEKPPVPGPKPRGVDYVRLEKYVAEQVAALRVPEGES